jgi:molybdate transport system substrate-binding protein
MLRAAQVVASAVLALTAVCGCGRRDKAGLRLYCGAAIRPPVAELVVEFQREQGVKMECDYAGSNLLLSRIRLTREGDLYMPGDVRYVQQAEAEGLIASSVDACYFIPVILVAKRSAKPVGTLADLAAPGLWLGFGDPEACAIGRVTEEIIEKAGIRDEIEANVVFRSLTANELGLQVKAGKLDATIVWDAIARQYRDVAEIVQIPRDANVVSTAPVAVLRSSEHPELARKFQEFVTSQRGREILARHGYTTDPPG